MEATRWSVTGDCLEPLARELYELANKVRQGSLGPGADPYELESLYRKRRIEAAAEFLKTLFSVEYGREFAERTKRVLEQYKTAEFWAFKALENHPFGNEQARNRLWELQETYRREVHLEYQKNQCEPEREDLLDRPLLLAMFDALERYDKLVSSLIALKDYLLVVAGLVRAKTTEVTSAAPPHKEPHSPVYLGGGVVKIGQEARTYQGKFQEIIELFVLQPNAVGPTIQREAKVENAAKEMRQLAERHEGFLKPFIEFPQGARGKGYTLKIQDSRKK